jgi:putative aldouronate transport system substrate-binding protein
MLRYAIPLEYGLIDDIEKGRDELVKQLKAAGIDKIKEEMQKQINAALGK